MLASIKDTSADCKLALLWSSGDANKPARSGDDANEPVAPPKTRPHLRRAPQTTSGGGAFAPDTLRGYGGYRAPQTMPQTASNGFFGPLFANTSFIPILGALPAVTAGFQAVNRSLDRIATMMPRQVSNRRNYAAVAPALAHLPTQPTASAATVTLLARRYVAYLDLENRALTRTLGEEQLKFASASLELASIACAILPTLHTMLSLSFGAALIGPLLTVLPPLFALNGCLHIIYHAGRLRQSVPLWVATLKTVPTTDPTLQAIPARDQSTLNRRLALESLYFACQTFFWSAYTVGMVIASGLWVAGWVGPQLGVLVLLTGVVGTTLMHFGWADRFTAPEGIDTAPPCSFNDGRERLRRLQTLDAEEARIEALRKILVQTLTPAQSRWYHLLWHRLLPLPYAGASSAWRVDRWLHGACDSHGDALLGVLTGLCHIRIQAAQDNLSCSRRQIALAPAVLATKEPLALHPAVLSAAQNAVALEQAHQDDLHATVQCHECLAKEISEARATGAASQALVQRWAVQEDASLEGRDVTQKMMTTLVHRASQVVAQERTLLLWIEKLAAEAALAPIIA